MSFIAPKAQPLKSAAGRAALCEKFVELRSENMTAAAAANLLGRSPSSFSGPDSMLARYQRGGLAALERHPRAGAAASRLSRRIEALGWFIPAANFFYLTAPGRGGLRRAVCRAMDLPRLPLGWQTETRARLLARLGLTTAPTCPAVIRREILRRDRLGKSIVPDRIARQITTSSKGAIEYVLELPVSDLGGPMLASLARRIAEDKPKGFCHLTVRVF